MKFFYYLLSLLFLVENNRSVSLKNEILNTENLSVEITFSDLEESEEAVEYKDFFENINNFFTNKIFTKKNDFFKSQKINTHKQNKKTWTILIYIAGVNDLYKYALRNISQMMEIGSSDKLNILIHFDFHIRGQAKETKRYYVEKDLLLDIGHLKGMDSGDAHNLIESAEWAIQNYPSDYFGLILWNHGTGPCDPYLMRKLTNPNDFFYYNEKNNKISLDRNKNFLETISEKDIWGKTEENAENNEEEKNISNDLEHTISYSKRGICFDDTTRNYLDSKKLKIALDTIAQMTPQKKISVLLMDACLMQGIEISYICRNSSQYIVASEEVVLGPGYNYAALLKILAKQEGITPYQLALETVKIYAKTYAPISNDFTQSAIHLEHIDAFVSHFKTLIQLFEFLGKTDRYEHIKRILKISASRELVTHFSEPTYVDLIHFLQNVNHFILQNPKKILFTTQQLDLIKNIQNLITKKIIPLIKKCIIANAVGENIPKAYGVYIYFPKKKIEESYKNNAFGIETNWLTFLQKIV